jgi:hypothetical protein
VAFVPHEQNILGDSKTGKHRKKSSCFTRLSRTKIILACLSCLQWRLFSGSCKSVFSIPKKRTEHCWVEKKELAVCPLYIEDALPSTSRCTCRLNNVHTYPTLLKITVTCFPQNTFTDPMLDVSSSCSMRCHPKRYRYVNAQKRGARHHAAVPHGWRHMPLLPMQVNERLPLMPVTTGDNAGYDQNDRHSGVESQQGILDGHHKVPHAPQKAHICSCAECLLEQLKRVHRQ